MSRIGKKPITIPKGVTVSINSGELEVKGAKGVLKTPIPEGITFKIEDETSGCRAQLERFRRPAWPGARRWPTMRSPA